MVTIFRTFLYTAQISSQAHLTSYEPLISFLPTTGYFLAYDLHFLSMMIKIFIDDKDISFIAYIIKSFLQAFFILLWHASSSKCYLYESPKSVQCSVLFPDI